MGAGEGTWRRSRRGAFRRDARAIAAALVIPRTTVHWGWQSGFIITGTAGFLPLLPWFYLYDKPESHRRLAPEERATILADRRAPSATPPKAPWFALFKHRELWVYVVIQAFVNPAWWFFVYWLPKFLGESFG